MRLYILQNTHTHTDTKTRPTIELVRLDAMVGVLYLQEKRFANASAIANAQTIIR